MGIVILRSRGLSALHMHGNSARMHNKLQRCNVIYSHPLYGAQERIFLCSISVITFLVLLVSLFIQAFRHSVIYCRPYKEELMVCGISLFTVSFINFFISSLSREGGRERGREWRG